ncbi:MAG: hypothetical protein HYT87_00045 [Nitrospirae bacterium]|nr:hypothetical protein [Nitrospirota bacterium]
MLQMWDILPGSASRLLLLTICTLPLTTHSCGGSRRESYSMDDEAKKTALQEVAQQEGREAGGERREGEGLGAGGGRRGEGGGEREPEERVSASRREAETVRSTPSVSLKANGIPLRMAMERLAAQAEWRVRWGEGVGQDATVSLDVEELAFQMAAEDLAAQAGYAAEFDFSGHSVTVLRYVERVFYLPEIWARRQMPLPGNGNPGVFIRYAEDPATGVENSIRSFLSPQGKVFVDPINGTVMVRDEHTNMRSLERYFARLSDEARTPWLVEVAILVASPGEQGIRWDKVGERLGSAPGAGEGPAALAAQLAQEKGDPVAMLLKALAPEKARLLSKPEFLTLNGWTVQLAVASGAGAGGAGWELRLTTHRDYANPSAVVIEAAGGLSDKVTQSFSTAASAEIGQPLIVSTGVGTSVEKGWLSDKRHTQEAIFVIRVLPNRKP